MMNQPQISLDESPDYLFIREIGFGTDKIVRLYFHRPSGYLRVVKLLREKNDDNKKNLIREATAMKEATNSVNVQFKRVEYPRESSDNMPFIETEFIPGLTLADLIEFVYQKIPLKNYDNIQRHIIIYGIAHSLSQMHASGVVHSDVKPDNIFLDMNMEPHIGSFKYSFLLHDDRFKLSGNSCFINPSPYFMAPEVARCEGFDERADIFSFGATVFNILTLTRLFNEDNDVVLIRTHISNNQAPSESDAASVRAAAPEYADLVLRCLSADPARRPPMSSVVAELEAMPAASSARFASYRAAIRGERAELGKRANLARAARQEFHEAIISQGVLEERLRPGKRLRRTSLLEDLPPPRPRQRPRRWAAAALAVGAIAVCAALAVRRLRRR